MRTDSLIALDWGTSALRGALLDAAGRVLERRDAPAGVQAVADGRFRQAFESLCSDWLDAPGERPVIAAGMIGSRQGWREAAYVEAPAGFGALAGALLRIDELAGRPFAIVPGVSCTLPAGTRDVMRGEEAQVFGALAADGLANATVLLPGTHSKWVEVLDRRIVSLRTYMTGELYAALAGHTILGRLFPPSGGGDPRFATHAFTDGLERAAADPAGLTALLFSVRAEGLFGRYAADALPSYLSGLLIGAEIAHALAARPAPGTAGAAPLIVVGAQALEQRYLFALERAGVAARPAAGDATFTGLAGIARAAGLLA